MSEEGAKRFFVRLVLNDKRLLRFARNDRKWGSQLTNNGIPREVCPELHLQHLF